MKNNTIQFGHTISFGHQARQYSLNIQQLNWFRVLVEWLGIIYYDKL